MDPKLVENVAAMLSSRGCGSPCELKFRTWQDLGHECVNPPQGYAIWYASCPVAAPFMKRFEPEPDAVNLLIYETSITFDAVKKLAAIDNLETFPAASFQFNLAKLIPRHVLWKRLNDPGYPKGAKFYPRLLVSDPACKYHGFRRGDLVHVHPHDVYVVI
ncbi:DNA-directed RNA polymerase II subunit [Largemouth bass virus]|uniref:DNA-directed RNA polymerase II subunit n=1 Tax=Largemouth bass virus TaxID=176656 RepID=A0A9E7PRA3_9VIRU|nr:putative DNA-directed RNA polymerase II subunit [Mandarin fish ranavirus]KIA90999.1 hypothetical protein OA88_22875 [Flavobacterium sp. JRM]QJE49087.1 hypothetical protein LMBV_024 [Largemouth bass virus]WHA35516.1 putative DNA-directed RNA polymerase II subunit [Micropterus salmoides ranavirus]WHA35621.1 putative DNA-directed RNA polymerase II subunit [Siniperca chuatsi ranavirus]